MTILIHIAERLLNRPLLVHPDKLPIALAVLQGRIPLSGLEDLRDEAIARLQHLPQGARQVLTGPAPEASRLVGDNQFSGGAVDYETRVQDGVAIVSVIGSLVNRGAWLGVNSGKTSYEGLKLQVQTAAADPKVRGILLDIHSGGGEATGAFELADAVRVAGALKPITAVVGGMAASAAYAIGAGAGKIVVNPTGVAGSIGVVMLHADFSKALAAEGVTPTFIFAGAHKVDGNQLQPLTPAVRADLQREVDKYYELFVASVAAGRNGLTPSAIKATEARTYIGEEAVQVGLADSVGTFEEALADLSRGSSRVSLSTTKGNPMTDTTTKGAAAAAAPATIAQADHDAAIATARAEGATAERERILGIEAHAIAGHELLVAEMKKDGKTTPDQAAARILGAEKELRGKTAQSIKDVETAASAVKPAPSSEAPQPPQKQAATTPDGWKAEYEASAALQGEFQSVGAYVAFKKAEAEGKVKILGKKSA